MHNVSSSAQLLRVPGPPLLYWEGANRRFEQVVEYLEPGPSQLQSDSAAAPVAGAAAAAVVKDGVSREGRVGTRAQASFAIAGFASPATVPVVSALVTCSLPPLPWDQGEVEREPIDGRGR